MSIFSTTKDKMESKVHSSQYIRTANEPDDADGTTPAEPVTPAAEPEEAK